MSGNDEAIWAQYIKGVKRLGQSETEEKKKQPVSLRPTVVDVGTCDEEAPAPLPPVSTGERFSSPVEASLDRRVERNLREGDVIIEARLDLHGLSEQAAHEKLLLFVETQARRGKRLLLVITGKGRNGESVLRTNFSRWCTEPVLARHIFALRQAAACHGGDGAWYMMLRRAPVR